MAKVPKASKATGRPEDPVIPALTPAQYCRLVGKPHGQIQTQVRAYGIPWGRRIKVGVTLTFFHQFLADHKNQLRRRDTTGIEDDGLRRQRDARADMLEDQRDIQRGRLIERDKIHGLLIRWASILRGAGERLAKRFGNEARDVLDEALDDCQGAVSEVL